MEELMLNCSYVANLKEIEVPFPADEELNGLIQVAWRYIIYY
jgi:hypothetical protein